MRATWIKKSDTGAVVVFVHGILSDGERCWLHEDGGYWPVLVKDDPALAAFDIYVFTYRTNVFSGSYRLGDVVDALKENLRLDGVLGKRRLVFVCHSMGGIVVRRYLVERTLDLIEAGVSVGLYLVASPSLGSSYADWLSPLARLFGHAQAEALRFVRDNVWLDDLDKEFTNLKESGRLPLAGKELVEDQFVVLRKMLRRQVVEPFSGAKYFGEPFKVPGSDHFSIAKPRDQDEIQHKLLRAFLLAPSRVSSRSEPRDEAVVAQPPELVVVETVRPVNIVGQTLADAVKAFLGSDPIEGRAAVDELIGRGDEAQDALFAAEFVLPRTFQVMRRWYAYAAQRHEAVAPLLLNHLRAHGDSSGAAMAAALCGAVPCKVCMSDLLYREIMASFHFAEDRFVYDYSADGVNRLRNLLEAYGNAGGSASTLWQLCTGTSTAWEKLRTFSFRGACAAFARCDNGGADAVREFVFRKCSATVDYGPAFGRSIVDIDERVSYGNDCVDSGELGLATTVGAFARWQRGVVADTVLSEWAGHSHARVRIFAAKLLYRFRFARFEPALRSWLDREENEQVRGELLRALDVILLDTARAPVNLAAMVEDWSPDVRPDEGQVVLLARAGHAHPQIGAMLASSDWFQRASGALALGYLGFDRLGATDRVLREASTRLERVLLVVALTLLGRGDLPASLHAELVTSASLYVPFEDGLDVWLVLPFVRVAILDALDRSATPVQRAAWAAEFEPVTTPC